MDDFNYDEIDFEKNKRGKSKGMPKRWSMLIIEGIIVLVALVAGLRFISNDTTNVSDLQATIDAQPTQPKSLTASDFFDRAMTEKETGLTESAIQSLTFAIELEPDMAEAYFERGELNYTLKRYYEASRDYDAALEHGYDKNTYTYYSLGMARFNRDDFWNAITAFGDALEIDSAYTNAYYWRGRSFISVGEYEKGIADIERALHRDYSEPSYAYFYIATAYDELEEYWSAIANYTKSIEISTKDCEEYECWIDYNNRGTTYYWLDIYSLAIEDYTQAIQLNPDEYPLALKNRGNAYDAQGEIQLALGDWNTMLQLLEGDVEIYQLTDSRMIVRDELRNNDSQAAIEFEGSSGETISITLEVGETSLLDAILMLRDPDGSPIAYSAPGSSPDASLIDINLTKDGTYTIVVASNLARSSGAYVLTLTK